MLFHAQTWGGAIRTLTVTEVQPDFTSSALSGYAHISRDTCSASIAKLARPCFRKILVSVKFLSATLGPEMGASILWTPGKCVFLQEKTMSIKFLFSGGGGYFGFWWGECRFYFYGRADFSDCSFDQDVAPPRTNRTRTGNRSRQNRSSRNRKRNRNRRNRLSRTGTRTVPSFKEVLNVTKTENKNLSREEPSEPKTGTARTVPYGTVTEPNRTLTFVPRSSSSSPSSYSSS